MGLTSPGLAQGKSWCHPRTSLPVSSGFRMSSSKENNMHDNRVALVTGSNQGVGFQVAKELVAHGLTVLVGSRNFEHREVAATGLGPGAIPLHLDVTARASIGAAAERIRTELGRLDVLVQNAAISNTRKGSLSLQ